eukprot:10942697-Lingulodinium_polyedra.AAC.1
MRTIVATAPHPPPCATTTTATGMPSTEANCRAKSPNCGTVGIWRHHGNYYEESRWMAPESRVSIEVSGPNNASHTWSRRGRLHPSCDSDVSLM